jgi:soluble lytic murein transglycosylase-like protein
MLVGIVLIARVLPSAAEDALPPTQAPTAPVEKPTAPEENNRDKPNDAAQPQPATPSEAAVKNNANKDSGTREAMCLMIESAAKAAGLPLEFFSRVIWQESRFQPDAVGPVTRNGERAQGIAQFMPGTASERRLLDPFDPVQALPKSAEFLSELRSEFGNLGLAAAAYNAGPRRVREWIEGSGPMPAETRNYVLAITGVAVDDWKNASDHAPARASVSSCRELMALLQRAPNPFVTGLEQRVKLGADRPWGVQLAAGFSRDRALATYARAMKRLTSVIGDRDPSLLGSIWRSRGTRTFYQVRIGTDTRPEADNLCQRIRHAGQACLVLRNMRVKG